MSLSKKRSTNYTNQIINSPIGLFIVGLLAIAVGILFIVMQLPNKPIQRRDAVAYSGEFLEYETSKNYCSINFKDGSSYEVYPHTVTNDFSKKMKALPKGTLIYICINPNNHYVVEIETATEELLNFEESQQAIDKYDNGYIALGVFACICGVISIFLAFGMKKGRRIEQQRIAQRKEYSNGRKFNSNALRHADMNIKSRILLKAEYGKYKICYRRVKAVNELVVNGIVYDEKRAIIEFEHKLCAIVDGNEIEAGLDKNSFSYINVNGKNIGHKERII